MSEAKKKLGRTTQCAKCPWKKSVDPHTIPGGYSKRRHAALKNTIAEPAAGTGLGGGIRMMACHKTPVGAEQPCVGWLAHQLGPGNNLALRLRVISGAVSSNFKTVGPQHDRFEDTLPRRDR